jgi:hypothetical protein
MKAECIFEKMSRKVNAGNKVASRFRSGFGCPRQQD